MGTTGAGPAFSLRSTLITSIEPSVAMMRSDVVEIRSDSALFVSLRALPSLWRAPARTALRFQLKAPFPRMRLFTSTMMSESANVSPLSRE